MTASNGENRSPMSVKRVVASNEKSMLSWPKGKPEKDVECMEEERLEAAQREAEQEWQALEAKCSEASGENGTHEEASAESRVPALLQMAANQARNDSSLTEDERKERAQALLTRQTGSEEAVDRGDGPAEVPGQQAPKETRDGTSGSIGGGARGQQLESLLCKAEQYSMFIRQSQADAEENRPIVAEDEQHQDRDGVDGDEADDVQNQEGPGEGRGRKRAAEASTGKGAGSKRKRGGGKDKSSPSASGKAFSSAASRMEKANEAKKHDETSFRQPDNLVGGKLKPYQLEGLRWLVTLYENGLSGILADEMGLGKTIQVIALIAHLRSKNVNGPFLVAAPLATLPNWVQEFRKWLPSVGVQMYHGPKSHRAELRKTVLKPRLSRTAGFPVVITSYEVSIIDRSALGAYNWQYLIIDEGQRIKNASCRLVQELKKLPSENRLLLSGTPIQNTLEELWSLLNFVNPQIFDDLTIFQSWFGFRNIGKDTSVDDIVDEQQHSKIVSKLHEILRPFLLRRMKKDVLADDGLPPKREVVVYAGMTTLQRGYYELLRKNALRETLMKMDIDGASRVSEMNLNMNQRKVCQHPFLFGEPKDKATGQYVGVQNPELLVTASAKLALMDRMLNKLKSGGHKVLIFSQMTKLMDLLEDYLRHRGWEYRRIDGESMVEDRQRCIDEFNTRTSIFVFLLSTRAGGLGINLCAADTCILFDSDWNPHQDTQAMARCHRIGQKKPVMVYRLLTTGSVEIDMMEKQISKKKLERMAVQGGDFTKAGRRTHGEMTVSQLRKLLEDDVEDLAKRAFCSGAGEGVDRAISEEELDGILDRRRVFGSCPAPWGEGSTNESSNEGSGRSRNRGDRTNGSRSPVVPLPREGDMYDFVDEVDASVLSNVS